MKYVIDKRWWTHELPGRNPDWWGFKRLLFSKYLDRELNINFSKIIRHMGSEIWAFNFESTVYYVFCELVQFAFFHLFGKLSFSKLCLKSKSKGFDIVEAHSFNMWMKMPSCLYALFGSKELIILVILSLEILNDEILSVVLKTKLLATVL